MLFLWAFERLIKTPVMGYWNPVTVWVAPDFRAKPSFSLVPGLRLLDHLRIWAACLGRADHLSLLQVGVTPSSALQTVATDIRTSVSLGLQLLPEGIMQGRYEIP